MLRTSYSTGEHLTALITIFRPSLLIRDTQATFKIRVSFSYKKLFFGHFSANLQETLHHYTNVETQLRQC